MIKISLEQLKKLNACEEGINWFRNQKRRSLKTIIPALLKDDHFDYARWLLSRLLTKEQRVMWAIQSAESVLPIFESRYPEDKRPREAIEVAKGVLAGTVSYFAAYFAANAAANAAYAANYAANAAYYAAKAAAYAAYAVTDTTNIAISAAANAAYAACYAYNAANAAYYASVAYAAIGANVREKRRKKEVEICGFALRLLEEK